MKNDIKRSKRKELKEKRNRLRERRKNRRTNIICSRMKTEEKKPTIIILYER